MFIIGLGTEVPLRRFKQGEAWAALEASSQFASLAPRSRVILRKVLNGKNGIDSRHLSFEKLTEAFALDPDTLHARFALHAPELAAAAGAKALRQAGIEPGEIDAVIISTCTGYLCPGLTSYVTERLGLRPNVHGLDLVGQGCGAAVPNLRTADALLRSGGFGKVLSICVEICSAAMYLDDDPGVLISACLFGDGAGAAVLSSEPRAGARRVEWVSSQSQLSPADRELLRFEQRQGMLRNILSPLVPKLAARHADELLTRALQTAGLKREQISAWIWHAGGREVLLALQEQLGLSEYEVRHSAGVLREYGNISSPCVLFVLERTLAENAPGGAWWLSAFGAGFSCHGALLNVE